MNYVAPTAQVSGSAQVWDSAQVSGSAQVWDSALVSGSATVSGSALVGGSARVGGSALVGGSARVGGSALVGGSARVGGSAQVSDHMVIDRSDGYICVGPIGSESRSVTAAWDYKRREICVRAGCWYGTVDELADRVRKGGTHGWGARKTAVRWRSQYEAVIALARLIPPPDMWPEVTD